MCSAASFARLRECRSGRRTTEPAQTFRLAQTQASFATCDHLEMSTPLRILAIAGSLRARSTNLLLLETAALLASADLRLEIFPELGNIPLFNPDRNDLPPAVATLRASIQAVDAIILSTPEYAHGLPGALKNALDWLVSGIELTDKPVVLFNASPRSVYAQAALREVLVTMGARFIDDACVTVPLTADMRTPQQLAADPAIAQPIAAALQRLSADITALAANLAAAASEPLGRALPNWQPRPLPERRSIRGRYSRIEPLDPVRHAEPLYAPLCNDSGADGFTYLPANPPADRNEWRSRLDTYAASHAASPDPLFFTLFDESGHPAGICAYLRIAPEHGSIEVGHIHLSPQLQRTRAATEIQYLLMRHAFDDLGYRRYEWKCDALNAPSRRAALRLGFRFEGIFLNAIVYRQRSRDTAWFSITDDEWPHVRRGFEAWLAPTNFDAEGRQLHSFASLRAQE
jgi:NAD(P)H-dependent FMN reductase/RimJ/RimL family protein N-acetyltransferase